MKLYLRILHYLRPHWPKILVAGAALLTYNLLDGLTLVLFLPFLRILFGKEPMGDLDGGGLADPVGGGGVDVPFAEQIEAFFRETFTTLAIGGSPVETLGRICLLILSAFLLKNLIRYAERFISTGVEQAVIRDLRREIFEHVQRLSLAFFHRARSGQIISRLTHDVEQIRILLSEGVVRAVRSGVSILVYLGLLVYFNWRLTLIALAVLPPLIVTVRFVSRRLRKGSRRMLDRLGAITATIQETIGGIRVVQGFGMEGYEADRFRGQTDDYYRTAVKTERYARLASPVSELLTVAAAVVVLWIGGRLILVQGSLEPEVLFLFLAVTLKIAGPTRYFSDFNRYLQPGLAAGERIFGLLDTSPMIISPPRGLRVGDFREAIRFEGVSFAYEPNRPVLEEINLSIRRGEVVAVVGPSGAGKTTLADLLPRFYDPTAGRITLDGQDLRDLDLACLRRLIGIVPQETVLFNETVAGNIAYGLSNVRRQRIEEAARIANAHDFILGFPAGYETRVGERGVRLSGGQRQRLAIARAVIKDPPILVFDEATSALDAESERLVQEAIERAMAHRTVLVIAHRLSTIRRADRIVVIEEGRIVEEGDHAGLMARGQVYARLYRMQAVDVGSSLLEGVKGS